MAANGANRKQVRDALTALLTTALVGAGKPAEAVYGYQKGNFGGVWPVVCVVSAGTERTLSALGTTNRNVTVFLDVLTFTLYADSENGWTEQHAEDRMDLLEKSISDVLADNHTNPPHWTTIKLNGRTITERVPIGGKLYLAETISLVAMVANS